MAVDGQAALQVWGVFCRLSGTVTGREAAPKPLSMGSPAERSHRALLGEEKLTKSMRAAGELFMKLVREQSHGVILTGRFSNK